MNEHPSADPRTTLKNPGAALLLALVLGGPGIFHLSIPAAILLFAGDMFIYHLGARTSGFGLILLIPWRLIACLYAMTAVTRHNKKILDKL